MSSNKRLTDISFSTILKVYTEIIGLLIRSFNIDSCPSSILILIITCYSTPLSVATVVPLPSPPLLFFAVSHRFDGRCHINLPSSNTTPLYISFISSSVFIQAERDVHCVGYMGRTGRDLFSYLMLLWKKWKSLSRKGPRSPSPSSSSSSLSIIHSFILQ